MTSGKRGECKAISLLTVNLAIQSIVVGIDTDVIERIVRYGDVFDIDIYLLKAKQHFCS